MSTAKFNQWLNSDGTENYKCRAWVNFNGTGTVAIRASGNVSSITDNGLGDYTVNFTNAMTDANYAFNFAGDIQGGTGGFLMCINSSVSAPATSSLRIRSFSQPAFASSDVLNACVTIFR
jgi:hypothetical protein